MKEVHEKEKSYQCDTCNKDFFTKPDLKKHNDSVHEKKKPYKCHICDCRCAIARNLRKHSTGVHEEPYKA